MMTGALWGNKLNLARMPLFGMLSFSFIMDGIRRKHNIYNQLIKSNRKNSKTSLFHVSIR